MFKKAIIASAVLAAATGFAFANGGTYQEAPHATHSMYVGVAGSRDFYTAHVTQGRNIIEFGDAGDNGELNAGIGWVFQDHYYLGAEIFGTISGAEIAVQGTNLKYEYSYGIDLVPGVKISDSTMLYGKVGYVRGEFEITQSRFFGTNDDDYGRNGLQLGIGMETMVTNNVSAKIEYDYNGYSDYNFQRNICIDNDVDAVKLGVAYHFMAA